MKLKFLKWQFLIIFCLGLRSIEDDYCEDIKEPEVCQSEGICDIKYYCSQCPETCGQCHNDKDVCSGKLKDCNIQPLCDNVCFDRRNETFCNQLKLDDGCNRSDDGENLYLSNFSCMFLNPNNLIYNCSKFITYEKPWRTS